MLKIVVGAIPYYVGEGVEMRRLWRRLVKHGFKGYKGATESPKYNLLGTYYMEVYGTTKTMYWGNFSTIAKFGTFHPRKNMPNYRQYKGNIELARLLYKY